MTALTQAYLEKKGWKTKSGIAYKDFINFEGDKYRIGWSSATHKLYMGYGELPCKVSTIEKLAMVLQTCGFYDEMRHISHW